MAYLAVVLLLPLLAVPLAIALGRSDFFLNHGASVWVRSNDAVFAMRERACDALIFGDSTAMTGVNPEILQHDTGLAACNISVTNSVLAVTENLALDRFLAQNKRPRVLIIQLSPESFNLRRQRWEETIYPEGLLEMVRWGDPRAALAMLWSHPRETLAFAGYSVGFSAFYLIKSGWASLTRTRAPEDAIIVRNGFFTAPLPALKRCTSATPTADTHDRSAAALFIAELQSRYRGRSDILLIDAAPIPICDANLVTLQAELHGLTSNTLDGLPVGLFNDDRHYTTVGSTLLSHGISRQCMDLLSPHPALNEAAMTSPAKRRLSKRNDP